MLCVAHPYLVHTPELVGKLHTLDLVGLQRRAETLSLLAQLHHQVGAHDALGEARIVLDIGRLLQQAAPCEALDDERREVGARGVQRRRISRGPAADDDRVLDLRHLADSSL